MKPVVFLPEAEQEMLEAARYYESQASGLGIDYHRSHLNFERASLNTKSADFALTFPSLYA